MMEKEGLFPEDREPTQDDIEALEEVVGMVGARLPKELLDECRFAHEVMVLLDQQKQFNDIDFDGSESIDFHELRIVMQKMGMEATDQEVETLMQEGDESQDGKVDFVEFVRLVRRFKSSAKERLHQQADRKNVMGLQDAVQNMSIVYVETEFGSKAVVERRKMHEWEMFMEYPDPLHWAAGKGDLSAVEQFVHKELDAPEIKPDRINKDQKMPLHYAAVWNQLHILRYLLTPPPLGAGVGVDPSDFNYVTPLLLAAERGAVGSVEFLIDNWANVNHRNKAGLTPLMLACKFGHVGVAEALLRAGAFVSGCDDECVRVLPVRREGLCRVVHTPSGFQFPKGPVYSVRVWQDHVLTGHGNGSVIVRSVSTQQEYPYTIPGFEKGPRVLEGHNGAVTCIKMENSSTTVPPEHMITGGEDATVRIWLLQKGTCLRVLRDQRTGQVPSPVTSVDLSPPTNRAVSGTRQGIFFVWDFEKGDMIQHYTAHQGMSVTVMQIEGDMLLSASLDRSVRLWDVGNNRHRWYQGHESGVNCALRLDKMNGSTLCMPEAIISGSNIGELFLWTVDKTPSTDPIKRTSHFGGAKEGLAFSSPIHDVQVATCYDQRLLAASSTIQGGVLVWNLDGGDGCAPLMKLVGHADDVRCLSWYGPDVNVTDRIGISPLMMACESGLPEVAKLLLTCADIDCWAGDHHFCETALHRAAEHGHVHCMELLLAFDPTLIAAGTANHSSVLHKAVLHAVHGPECVRVCVRAGADVNMLNDEGLTPAHVAARLGRYKALRELCKAPDLDLNRPNADYPIGGQPLSRPKEAPVEHKYPKLVSAATQMTSVEMKWVSQEPRFKAGARRNKAAVVVRQKNVRHRFGWSMLHEACAFGHTACVTVLLERGIDVNARDDYGRQPLHLACANGTPDMIEILLECGAEINPRDVNGCTPLHYCVKVAQDLGLKKLVQRCGDDLELDCVEDIYGLTPIHMAAKYGLEEMCYLLLEAGADPNSCDIRVCTPLHYAVSGEVIGVVDATPPEVPHEIVEGSFGMHDRRNAAKWLALWEEGELSRRGLSDERITELRDETASKYGRFVETAQVLLDGFSCYNTCDVSGMTALQYAQAHPKKWPLFREMFASTTPDGLSFMVQGDFLTARYLGEKGTKYESPNLWHIVSRYGVRCEDGLPKFSGSRAFKKFESRFVKQEIDWKALGELKIGEAGELDRRGCTVYELTIDFVEESTGLEAQALSFLCMWDSKQRTFQTKFNALFVGIEVGKEYTLRVDSVDDWVEGMPKTYKRAVEMRRKSTSKQLQERASRGPEGGGSGV